MGIIRRCVREKKMARKDKREDFKRGKIKQINLM
jgi:hypothetical protein